VCFRYSKFHEIFDNDQYPVDAKIIMHREAYLGDHTIAKELATLIAALQGAGLEFVAVFGESAASTTNEFAKYLQEPGAIQHGEWQPSKELKEKFATKIGPGSGGDHRSAAWREKHGKATA
jgi:hypothetical protein